MRPGALRRGFFSCGGAEVEQAAQPLREQYLRLTEDAARSGVRGADEFWRLTPREITCRLRENAQRARAADLMAWIAARYISLAVNAPDRMPAAPVFFPRAEKEKDMSGAEMKERLRALGRAAPKGESEHDAGRT